MPVSDNDLPPFRRSRIQDGHKRDGRLHPARFLFVWHPFLLLSLEVKTALGFDLVLNRPALPVFRERLLACFSLPLLLLEEAFQLGLAALLLIQLSVEGLLAALLGAVAARLHLPILPLLVGVDLAEPVGVRVERRRLELDAEQLRPFKRRLTHGVAGEGCPVALAPLAAAGIAE